MINIDSVLQAIELENINNLFAGFSPDSTTYLIFFFYKRGLSDILILKHPKYLCTNRSHRCHGIFTTLGFFIYRSCQITTIYIYSTTVTSVNLLESEESI